MEKLDHAAQAAGITREHALQNIVNTVAQAQGQQRSVDQSTGMHFSTSWWLYAKARAAKLAHGCAGARPTAQC
jgi:hypothetical protein